MREREQSALDKDDAEKAGQAVSTFAEAVDECTESSLAPASLGEALREKFEEVGKSL